MQPLVPPADQTEPEGHWVPLNCVGLNVTHAFPYPWARAGHMALPIPRGLENVCVGVTRGHEASPAVGYHRCRFILSCVCIFSSCLQVLIRSSSLCYAPAALQPTCTIHVCLLPTCLTMGMLSTLCQADLEAHHIPWEFGYAGKISQMLVILIPLHFERDPPQRQPSSYQRSVVTPSFVLIGFVMGIPVILGRRC